jgi:hypothetical protein
MHLPASSNFDNPLDQRRIFGTFVIRPATSTSTGGC